MSRPIKAHSRWGPRLDAAEVTAVWVRSHRGELLPAVRLLQESLGVPVQAVRGDRVLSWVHLVMAAEHQKRSWVHGRAANDPGVEFVRFLAARKQIQRALGELGVPQEEPAPPLLIVAFAGVEDLEAAVRDVGLVPLGRWTASASDAEPVDRLWRQSRAHACVFWNGRLGLAQDATDEDREAGVLAMMARLALET